MMKLFIVTLHGRNVNKPNVSMLLFPPVYHKSLLRDPWGVLMLAPPS